MFNYYYICSTKEQKYSEIFTSLGYIEGDRNDLVTQVENNKGFCRNSESIAHSYFLLIS